MLGEIGMMVSIHGVAMGVPDVVVTSGCARLAGEASSLRS